MHWELTRNGGWQGSSVPWAVFKQGVTIRAEGLAKGEEIELVTVKYWATSPDLPGVSWQPMTLALEPGRMFSDRKAYLDLLFPYDRRFVGMVEDRRQGRSEALRLEMTVDVSYRKVREIKLPPDPDAKKQQISGLPYDDRQVIRDYSDYGRDQIRHSFAIGRDEWLAVLKAIGWDEFEIFEVPVRSLKSHDLLQKGLEHLRTAQTAFRQGQYPAAITEARKACEAAAGTSAPEADQAAAFKVLLGQILPDAHDEPKRKALSSMMLGVRDLRHPSAHGGDIRIQIHREDAELALTVAVAVFRFMGETLGKEER